MHAVTDSSGESMLLRALCANMHFSSSGACKEHVSPWPLWPLLMTDAQNNPLTVSGSCPRPQEEVSRYTRHSSPPHPWGAARKQHFLSKEKARGTSGDTVSLELGNRGVSHRAILPARPSSPQLCTWLASIHLQTCLGHWGPWSQQYFRPSLHSLGAKHRRISVTTWESLYCLRFFPCLKEGWCWGWNLGPYICYMLLCKSQLNDEACHLFSLIPARITGASSPEPSPPEKPVIRAVEAYHLHCFLPENMFF